MKVFKIKTGSENTYEKFNNPDIDKIFVDHLIQYDDIVEIGSPVFFLFGGDGTPWENGLAGICKIISKPLELGYEIAKNGKYYKLELEIIYKLKSHMTKMDFAKYPETFDTGIGPSTKGERNQALGIIDDKKSVAAICRALIDKEPEISSCILKIFGNEIFTFAKENSLVYIDPKNNFENGNSHSQYSPTQTIYYGVPGSGKSHKIDEKTKGLPDEQKIRVVFHPEYTNADFVGQILPKVKNGSVEYEFKPGPFTKILYRAYHNYNIPYCLIIEEINRGNAAAIFGDVFQLLDRIKKGDTPENINGNTFGEGWSKYFVENEFINNYLRSPVEYSKEGFTENHDKKSVTFKSGITFSENTGIRLPPNLSIYATMNTSDQNVFTLDNAFQRRWEMELVQNVVDKKDENGIKQMNAKITVNNQSITWEDFQTQINSIIGKKSNEGGLSSMEDKRLGCWFIKAENGVIDEKHFANKVLKYLWDDAFKFCHQEIFESDIKNFEELQNRFLKTGFDIFSENCGLKNYLSNNQSDSQSQSNPVNPQDSEPSEENSEQ